MKHLLRWLWIPLTCGILWAGYYRLGRPNRGASSAKSSATPGRGGAPRSTPVGVAAAARSDFSVYLTGLGSVTPFNTVTVKSRVDGNIAKVAFTEGQYVRAGDLLVQIDPRPYQAQLE